MKTVIWLRRRILEKCVRNATVLLPICQYLENFLKERYTNQKTSVFFEGINPSYWYNDDSMELRHPCVGLLQDANIWYKSKEMLVLNSVIPKMPNVNFYWAGDGPYKDRILSELSKFENFKWLGRLQYPEKVRKFLSSVDAYALVSGLDNAPLTLKEAQILEKPVVASNVGGIPEMMIDGKTGFLVDKGDAQGWIEKLSKILNDKDLTVNMGKHGKEFIQNTFNWDTYAKKFLDILDSNLVK
jgi:glycosyltransferase involved in cell wall biosynthesis